MSIAKTVKERSVARTSDRVRSVPWSPIRHMMGLAASMPDVISLTVGQPDYDTPRHIVEACKAALDARLCYGSVSMEKLAESIERIHRGLRALQKS